MIPKTFYIRDIYESFLGVILFLFLPVKVIPVVCPTRPKNHFLLVKKFIEILKFILRMNLDHIA